MSRLRDSNALRVAALYAAFAVALPIGGWLSNYHAWLNIAFAAGLESLLQYKPTPIRLAEAQADSPIPTIATPAEFDSAANEELCVLFVDAGWVLWPTAPSFTKQTADPTGFAEFACNRVRL